MNYLDALKRTKADVDAGHLIAYSVDWTKETGKRIWHEFRDAGWSPYPAWIEHQSDDLHDTGDYLPE